MRREKLRVPRIAAWAIAGVFFLGVSRFHQHITILGTLKAPMLLSITALGVLFLNAGTWRPADVLRHWLTKGVLVLGLIAALGIPFALYPGRAFEVFNESYSRTLLLWLVGWGLARTVVGARFLTRVLASAGITAAVLAYMLDRRDSAGRLSGAYTYDPNDLALVCVITLPLVFWWLIETRRIWIRLVLIACAGLLVYVVVRTSSRAGFLGLATVVLTFGYLMRTSVPKKVKRISRWVLVGCILASPLAPPEYVERIRTMGSKEEDYNRTSDTGRVEIWKRGMGYGLQNPILGVGIGNFTTAEGWLAEQAERQAEGLGWKWSTAHNSFVLVWAELGVIAGILFPYLLLRGGFSLLRWHRRQPPWEKKDLLPPFIGIAILALCVNGSFLSFAYYDIVYALLAIAAGLLHPLKMRAPRDMKPLPASVGMTAGPRRHGPVPGRA